MACRSGQKRELERGPPKAKIVSSSPAGSANSGKDLENSANVNESSGEGLCSAALLSRLSPKLTLALL
jgi:hypothetical protein